ncbi:hypothetical protein COCC4DRAFT_58373 [Bipolaris maydis ATCC 48331]|uniref:Uncharacterized protein n=2 Tax=Cochliobolus heterostrophus TaxID=5016 RepID=M2UKT1_COCH5|nr:uncharacterized protein COCC4DRAFT_58373 [Bipolaris maydis ATCC 48331]EMD94226.1 hypothetical protein COCHEDRAFT_1028152 [Bipolaris maydis C5]KAJ5026593.1 hypothetical protein J3E73DRAFT_369637 [Bipolaris maydis]ENI07476.1 hypothetical protein COCC4DRAFT_58373 [Bipolaris maydis ATCC 48331]KAJ6271349.1 hypothetical protein PSV08DRAFT_350917 [Bipolaris maydis]KAJ6282595.1 hypothetical protein J3E71DRAFT_240159 [Bipolaris maydis]
MPHVVEDYYDMPVELLPSANFAGRPTSDIDMLAGLWATAASYSNFSSSEDEADGNGHDDNDRDDKASPQRRDGSSVSPPPPTETESREERPSTTTITLPPTNDIRVSSGVVRGLARARLRRKAHSTPYGNLASRASPLVEAVEAAGEGRVGGVGGLGYFDTIRRKHNNREKEGEQRRKKRVRSCDVEMSKRGMMGELLAQADAQAQGSGAAISPSSAKQSRTSLAQQTRVGPKRQGRQLAALDTDVAGYELSSRGCIIRGGDTTTAATVAGSPSSVLLTPQELYAIGKGHAASETLGSPQVWCARNDNPANIMVVTDKMCSPPSPSNMRWGRNGSITHTHTDTQHRRSSVDVAGGRIIYVPGTMMLAREPVKLRRDSVATALDACTFDGTKLASEEKRYAELVGLEEDVVTFFEELGVVAEATEASLDRYWLCNGSCSSSVEQEGHDDKASLSSTASVGVGEAESDKAQGSRASRFSFSSASSCSAPVSSHRHRRKRSRLIELLLSPGMPGAVFANAPAS